MAGPLSTQGLVLGGSAGGAISNALTQLLISPSGRVDADEVLVAALVGGALGSVFQFRSRDPDLRQMDAVFNTFFSVLLGSATGVIEGFLELFGVPPADASEAC